MTAKDYKIVISILLTINVICLVIIATLCGEIYLLQTTLSETADTVRLLEDKISRIEVIQEETLLGEKRIEKSNGYILGGALIIIGIITSMYFGGIDPGALGKALNLSADQLTTDFVSQNKLIDENTKLCLRSIDFMHKSILAEMASRSAQVNTKTEVIFNKMMKKDINSLFSELTPNPNDWE